MPGRAERASEWMFENGAGRPLDSDNFRKRYWARVVAKAKVIDHGTHGLRHTWATHRLEDGELTLFQVSRALGHASISTTADTCGHVLPDGEPEAWRQEEQGRP